MKICNLSPGWELHTPGLVHHATEPVVLDPALAGHLTRDWLLAVERWLAYQRPDTENPAWVAARLARNLWKGQRRASAARHAIGGPVRHPRRGRWIEALRT